MVAMEGPTELPLDHRRQRETERTKPALPGARTVPETREERGREGNHPGTFFSIIAVTGQAATSASRGGGEVLCNASVRAPAAVRWNWCGNGSGAGNKRRIKPRILIGGPDLPYIQHVRCNWNFTNSTGAGNICESATRKGSGG